MREAAQEIDVLQSLLDASHASAGGHLRGIFTEAARLTARELVDWLDGVFEMHLATVTRDGAPLVAPIDGIFLHGKVFFSVPGAATRARLLKRDPRVSASYTAGSLAFIVHGTAVEIVDSSELGDELLDVARELYVKMYGRRAWDQARREQAKQGHQGFSGHIEPRVMFAKR